MFEKVIPVLLILLGILTVALILFAAGILLGLIRSKFDLEKTCQSFKFFLHLNGNHAGVSPFMFSALLRAPRSALLVWGIGLAMFGLGSFAEVYLALAWSRAVFDWYLFGAI